MGIFAVGLTFNTYIQSEKEGSRIGVDKDKKVR